MKGLLTVILAMLATAALGGGLTSVEINGNSYSNISKAYAGSNGKIIIIFPDGGTSASADSVPKDFLKSWDITVTVAKAAPVVTAQNNQEQIIRAGCFREVDGVVYDVRRAESGWVSYSNVKVLQIVDGGAILVVNPEEEDYTVIFLKDMSPSVGDTDYLTFTGKPDGSHSYINDLGETRTVKAYTLGRICARADIPASVLSGEKAYAVAPIDGVPQTDVLAQLPDSSSLTASGSGFFVSADGYLITDNHVVKDAGHVKVKIGDEVFPAEVVRVDADSDLALLKVSGEFKPLGISMGEVDLGDAVYTIGFPDIDLQGTQPKYTDGKISSLSGIKDDPNEYQISVPVQPGNSGGPLVDKSGKVCGVIVARLNDFAAFRSTGGLPQNVNYATKGKLLRDFLGQGAEVKFTSNSLATGDTSVATVQKSVGIILVY